jgi:multidrug efflux pump
VTLSAAVMISLVISLTTTPMMCAWLLRPMATPGARAGWRAGPSAASLEPQGYEQSLDWALAARGWCC